MPVHTPLWRTQEGIVTLTMVPAEPEPTAVASAAASPTSANPFAQEPLFDQIFIYTACASSVVRRGPVTDCPCQSR